MQHVFTYRRIFFFLTLYITVSVKEDEIRMEGNKAEKAEREFVYRPLNDLPWANLDEKGMTFHSVDCVFYELKKQSRR